MSKKKVPQEKPGLDKQKGRLVESIVARMHEAPGVRVETNVFLPVHGPSRRTGRVSEIDVLVTANIVGYPVRLAFECKNYGRLIDAPKINEFVGKLQDVGIPASQGIYVAATGFTKGAIQRAAEAGIQTLVLTGLAPDRLSAAMQNAFQSVVYLLPVITNIMVTTGVKTSEPSQFLAFFDQEGQFCGFAPDLVWKRWVEGSLLLSIGEHHLELEVPSEWHQIVDGQFVPTARIAISVEIRGLVVTFPGQAELHELIDPVDEQIRRIFTDVTFPPRAGTYPVSTFRTETELQNFLQAREGLVTLTVGRVRLPRLLHPPLFWPPSQRVIQKLKELAEAHAAWLIPDPGAVDLREIEGEDLRAVWEPIWPEYPVQPERTKNGPH